MEHDGDRLATSTQYRSKYTSTRRCFLSSVLSCCHGQVENYSRIVARGDDDEMKSRIECARWVG